MNKKGKISVTTENIFPIIKQWLYSSQDIFLREVVSNSVDAITKRRHLANLGKIESMSEEARIDIILNQDNHTLTVSDNGIGMSAEEMDKYINEIAYSGLVDFVEKYQKESDSNAQIIGHFGLGFYSTFMVSDKVEIISKSSLPDQAAVHWQSEEGIEFEISSSDKTDIGTSIVMHLTDEAVQTYSEHKLREIVNKYCQFMQYPIYFDVISEDMKLDDEDAEAKTNPINNPDPLWNKRPNQVKDDEYIDFYYQMFPDGDKPLFWVHLNLDYPFRLKGILYFPRINLAYENLEGRIKVYYNQVYVADNIPEIIPEFLFLLRGAIDCPDLPLNVSRSFLQDDQYVKKLSGHIVKKVADRLVKVAEDQPEQYKEWWQYLQLFVKYGMMKDQKFSDRVYDVAMLKDTNGNFTSLKELKEGNVYYTPGQNELSAYVAMANRSDHKVFVLDEDIDIQWMSFLEFQSKGKIKFARVDAESESEKTEDISEKDKDNFEKLIAELDQEKYQIKYQKIGKDSLPILIRENEENRRMRELFEQIKSTGDEETINSFQKMLDNNDHKTILIVNTDQPILQRISSLDQKDSLDLVSYFLKLAKLGQGDLTGNSFIQFLESSAKYAFESTDTIRKDE